MFIPYLTAVVSSMAYWPNPPSPLTLTTGRVSPTAAHAPMAAGKLNPIDPKYPDISTSWFPDASK